jgi:hypothetical protein
MLGRRDCWPSSYRAGAHLLNLLLTCYSTRPSLHLQLLSSSWMLGCCLSQVTVAVELGQEQVATIGSPSTAQAVGR